MRFTYTNDLAENTDVCPECNKYFKLATVSRRLVQRANVQPEG